MIKRNKEVNEGGINGLGIGVVNTNSAEFKALRQAVESHSAKTSRKDIVKYALISAKLQMQNYVENSSITKRVESGEFLKNFIDAIGVKNNIFASYVEVEESNLSAMMKGKRRITTELAFKLGELFEMNPNIWMMVQVNNDMIELKKETQSSKKKYKLSELIKKAS